MPTRKKVPAKTASKDQTSHRSCRQQKKVTVITDRKVTELITSSAKKLRNGALQRKSKDTQGASNLNSGCAPSREEKEDICIAYEGSLADKPSSDRDAQCALETIFSPNFHLPKDVCGGVLGKGDFVDIFRRDDQAGYGDHAIENSNMDTYSHFTSIQNQPNSCKNISDVTSDKCGSNAFMSPKGFDMQHTHSNISHMESNYADSSSDGEYRGLGKLSSEVSAIYLAMQHSKLECVDEMSHDPLSTEICVEPDEDDEFDDFDPYLFIKRLPDLSAVVPTFRLSLLPKQTRSCPSTTLVLDLDETLVHSTLEPCEDADFSFPVNFNLSEHMVYVRCRPYLKEFMEKVANQFEIIIFTASQSIYAEQLLNVLDPKRRVFRHRVYRESCVYVDGNYLKDLSILGRDLARVIIIDNSPQAFGFQLDNGIPIESWFDDNSDRELLLILPFLESLVGVDDVRPLIAKKFDLRKKVAASDSLSSGLSN